MTKIHTRKKRLLGIRSLHRKHRFYFSNVTAKKGAKSFTSKEQAQSYAKAHKLEEQGLVLHVLPGGKYQWRPQPRE